MDFASITVPSLVWLVFNTTLYAAGVLVVVWVFGFNGFPSTNMRHCKRCKRAIDPPPRHGGDLVAEALVQHGVEFVFCLIGGHISPILVGCKRRGIRVVDVRHEATAVFAADGVSRVGGSRQIGVACVTAGPGLTNTITAIQNASMAQSPLVLLGGATLGLFKGRGSLQDIDQLGLVKGLVKWKTSASKITDIIPKLEEAFFRATNGVPGPVFVELPLDVLYPEDVIRDQVLAKFHGKTGLSNTLTKYYLEYYLNRMYGAGVQAEASSLPWRAMPQPAPEVSIRQAATMLLNAKKPLMVVGSQAVLMKKDFTAGAEGEGHAAVLRAIRDVRVPVFLAGGARGCLGTGDEDAKLHIRHKRSAALKRADVVVLLGVPFDFRLNYGYVLRSNTVVISVGLDKKLLYLNRRPTLPVHAEVPDFLIRLERLLSSRRRSDSATAMQLENRWESWRVQLRDECDKRDCEIQRQSHAELPEGCDVRNKSVPVCNPLSVCLSLDESLSEDSVLVCDGGDFIGTAAYTVRPRGCCRWLDPGPFGTLGVGAGFAMGAKLVRPEADVWLLWGDGSAAYSIMEFDTFSRHEINVIGLVGNDACWRQIERDQVKTFDDDNVGCMLAYSDYHKVAEALGGKGYLVNCAHDMKSTIQKAREDIKTKPVLINVLIGKTKCRLYSPDFGKIRYPINRVSQD